MNLRRLLDLVDVGGHADHVAPPHSRLGDPELRGPPRTRGRLPTRRE